MNPSILHPEVQAYLRENAQTDPRVMALGKSPFADVSPGELATQLDGRQRSRHKLPLWHATEGIYYPAKLSIEQCSSEATARYKTGLLAGTGLRILDMTGGLGVDSTLLARAGHQITHSERDPLLSEIARHNAGLLTGTLPGAGRMQFVSGDGITLLGQAAPGQFDVIYLDPARRSGSRKTFRLDECEPNILDLHGLLLEKSPTVLLKLSPMLDLRAAIEQIPGLQEIHVLSVDGECKELVCRVERTAAPGGSTKIIVAALSSGSRDGGMTQRIAFTLGEEKTAEPRYALPQQYLYEPDAALLKSGAFKWTGQHFGLSKLHQHTHLYTSEDLIEGFIGKTTKIEEVIPYTDFKKSKHPLSGNVITRNFPIKAEEIRRKHRIKENASQHLYFCTDQQERLILIQTTDTP